MTEVSSNKLTEAQIQATCPPFCEYVEHYNSDTPDTPLYLHGTEDHVVHGFRIRIVVGTDERGEEQSDEPLSITVNDEVLSLREARDLMNALGAALHSASLTDTGVRTSFEADSIGKAARLGLIAEHTNHEKHLRARETRKATSIDLRAAQ